MNLFQFDRIKKFRPAPHWVSPLLSLTMAVLGIFYLYSETLSATVSKWLNSETYAHGMLVVPLSLYMIWTKTKPLSYMTPRPTFWSALFLLLSVLAWLFGTVINVLVLQQLAVLTMIWAVVYGVLGYKVVSKIIFPLVFLVLAIPLGEELIPVLMDITALFTVKALQLTGLPVFWEGMYFEIPAGSFEVAKACSGIRYMSASLTIGCVFAYLYYQSFWRRSVFILISILLPILANGIRAYGIVMIAHLSDMKYAVGVDHLVYGWLFFGVIMFLLFYIGNRWREEPVEKTNYTSNDKVLPNTKSSYAILLVSILSVAALGPIKSNLMQQENEQISRPVQQLPEKIGQWNKQDTDLIDWKPEYRGASHQIQAVYSNGNKRAQVYIAYYKSESQHAELINQVNRLYDPVIWIEIKDSRQTVLNEINRSFEIRQKILKSGENRRLMWYWYDLDGYATQNIYRAKLYQAWTRIIGQDTGGAVVAIFMDREDTENDSAQTMNRFLQGLIPSMQSSLNKLRYPG